jgi:hypothetical protein
VLPKLFNDRFLQMMSSKLVDLKRESSMEFSKADAEAVRRGEVSTSSTAGLRNQADIHLVKRIITVAVVLQRELISELQIPFSDTLAGELKDQVKAYMSNERCEEMHEKNTGGISDQHAARLKEELYVNRSFFLKRADAQIALFVDSLRRKQSGSSCQSQMPPK